MRYRLAKERDTDNILEAARKIHGKFDDIPFEEDVVLDNIFAFIDKPDTTESMMVVAEDDEGNFKGVIAAMLTITPFSMEPVASEVLFWVDNSPEVFKKLHKAYLHWSKAVNAKVVTISAPPDKEYTKWDKFYKTLGYHAYEHKFVQEVH